MRHQVFGRKLGRDINSRKALLAGLSSSLLENGQITTTVTKAKFVKPYVEKLITRIKKKRLFLHRQAASTLTSKAFSRLTFEIGPGFIKRPGGYTRIIRLSRRSGDSAPMARLELLEWEKSQTKPKETKAKPKKTNPGKTKSTAKSKVLSKKK